MTTGRKQAELNVTPLIDVLLVLLIIFMVSVPNHSVGLNTAVPQEPAPTRPAAPNLRTVVVSVAEDGSLTINSKPVEFEQLGAELMRIFVSRAEKVLFVTGQKDTEFRRIATVIDIARGVGISQVALLKPTTLLQ
ncbi:MAG: biopolymer transporter ExbD [Bryobacteraceae bacterium]